MSGFSIHLHWLTRISLLLILVGFKLDAAEPVGKLDFNRDIRPILSNHCWNCHGQDEASRKASLRLDIRDQAIGKTKSDDHAIVPGDANSSAMVERIDASDDAQMPPKSFKKPLGQAQKAILKRWISEGAPYANHWAFDSPKKTSDLPLVKNSNWPKNEIDRFVLQKLELLGKSPSPSASRSTWLRRVTLDLTGLPPSPAETLAFLSDESPKAHEAVVDRLLASPRHAERMAMHWLDAARYADTNGYNNDEVRTLWPWRDWVIKAYAGNMPYDQFLTEQLAGDLLPNATLSQKVATGFNRNHVLTTEGGIIDEEYRVEYVADRVHTTSTVFMGLSMQCARCHDHKYDPISQRDYYRFAAFFNNIPDKVVSYNQGRMAEPLLKVPSPAQQAQKLKLESRQEELAARLKARSTKIDADLAKWESQLTSDQISRLGQAGLLAHFPLDEATGPVYANRVPQSIQGSGKGKLVSAQGHFGGAVEFTGETFIEAGQTGAVEADQAISLSAWIFPKKSGSGTVVSKMDDDNSFRGYDLILEEGKVASHFINHWPDKAFKVMTKQAITTDVWHHVAVSYDGSRKASGIKIYVDGKPQELSIATNNVLEGTLKTDQPFHIGRRQKSSPFLGKIDDIQIYSMVLGSDKVQQIASGQLQGGFAEVLKLAKQDRKPDQVELLRGYYLDQVDEQSRRWKSELAEIPKQLSELDKAIPVTMVMAEMVPRRPTHILKRGQYDQLGDVVQTGLPGVFRGDSNESASRLDMARWLTSPSHPLTARVAVNRWWEMLFGVGLVETVEDFGVQGSLPTHPELLDWLALELVGQNWNTRAMLKKIVLSATYQQSSHADAALLESDPRNHLLGRGPRYRLPAETVRDNALAISGLLVEKVGGPSVKPYQPEGLWEDVSVERREKYAPDLGPDLYRRSMYTFWKRTCPPPGMAAFDAPDRETCLIRRARTNTPLQALVLLNDPTYVEAARKFAERLLSSSQSNPDRLFEAYQLALSRSPRPDEIKILMKVYESARKRFEKDRASAGKLIAIGHSKRLEKLDPAELAAWTTVTSMILNLDETISKP